MNILKGIQQGGRGTKWFLCPLHKPVSHPAASLTLVSHKSKKQSCITLLGKGSWVQERSCVCVCIIYIYIYIHTHTFSRERELGGRLDRQKECETENRGTGCEKRAKENVWAGVSKMRTCAV